MPGGRLSRQERQQIATGLTGDLSYAEIGRRIDRPTSTVTREVTRNGGPTGYRADLAHRAAEHRARRRAPGTSRRVPPDVSPPGGHGEEIRRCEQTLTVALMASGLPKMPARVLTCLLTTDRGSLTAAELGRHLHVSAASVSKAIAFLDGQSLIRRHRDERRRDHYVVDDDLFYQATIASARSNDHLAETARRAAAVLGPGTASAARLENVARFLDFIGESITRAAEEVRAILHPEPDPEQDGRSEGPRS